MPEIPISSQQLQQFLDVARQSRDGSIRLSRHDNDSLVNKGTLGHRVATFFDNIGRGLGLLYDTRSERQSNAITQFKIALKEEFGEQIGETLGNRLNGEQKLTGRLVLQVLGEGTGLREDQRQMQEGALKDVVDGLTAQYGGDIAQAALRHAGLDQPGARLTDENYRQVIDEAERLGLERNDHDDLDRIVAGLGREIESIDRQLPEDGIRKLHEQIRDFKPESLKKTETPQGLQPGVHEIARDRTMLGRGNLDEGHHDLVGSNNRIENNTIPPLFRENRELPDPGMTTELREGILARKDEFLQAIAQGDEAKLGDLLAGELAKSGDPSLPLQLIVGKGEGFIDGLMDTLGADPGARALVEKAYDHAVTHLPGNRVKDDHTIEVGGKEYVMGEKLGGGSFGEVYRFDPVDPNGKPIVVKTMLGRMNDPLGNSVLFDKEILPIHGEIRALHAVGDGTVRMLGALKGPGGVLSIAMELAPGGDLDKLGTKVDGVEKTGDISLTTANRIRMTLLRDMIESMRDVQERAGLVHFDVKPQNFLVDENGMVKSGDFGFAVPKGGMMGGGTPKHMAPESLRGDPDLDGKVDTWALGTSAYRLFFGEDRFGDGGQVAQFSNDIESRIVGRDQRPGLTVPEGTAQHEVRGMSSLDRLLNQLSNPDPAKRPELGRALESSLFEEPGLGSREVRELIKFVSSDKLVARLLDCERELARPGLSTEKRQELEQELNSEELLGCRQKLMGLNQAVERLA